MATQSIPRAWWLAGAGIVGGASLLLMSRPSLLTREIGNRMTTAVENDHLVAPEHACDCKPLWNCMNENGRDCSALEASLRLCMMQHKVPTSANNKL